jgi:hypothetical protein
LENPVNHKLRVLVRVDVDPGHVTLEVTGCLTQANYPALLHIVRRASRLAAGSDVSIDLHGASHLDPEILLYLRQLAATNDPAATPEHVAAAAGMAPGGSESFGVRLQEPAELPICLLHVGSDGEALAGLDGEISGAVNGRLLAEVDTLDGAGPAPDGTGGAAADPELIEGLELSDYFEGTLDPAATVQALSDTALGQLADALYRHLDTPSPSFGAHTWYELAAEELEQRYRATDAAGAGLNSAGLNSAESNSRDLSSAGLKSAPDGPADGELAAGPVVA